MKRLLTSTTARLPRAMALSFCILLIASGGNAHAQGLTYDEANDGFIGTANVLLASGGSFEDHVVDENMLTPDGGDGFWGTREFGSGGTIYNAGDNPGTSESGENVPEIVQTITGLTNGTNLDIYAVFWSAAGQDWGIRAGFSMNAGANQYFSRTGDSTFLTGETAIKGQLAGNAFWQSLPDPNPETEFDPANGVFTESDRAMYLAKVGSRVVADNQIQVYLDDLSTAVLGGPTSRRTWFDGLAYVAAGTEVVTTATVDRTTGALSVSGLEARGSNIVSYSVTSTAGSLDDSGWQTISAGTNTAVSDTDTWNIDSLSSTDLTESEASLDDGAVLGAAGLPLGNVSVLSPFEDIQISITLADSSVINLSPEYINGSAIEVGNFNADANGIDLADYEILLNNLHKDPTATTRTGAHMLGDVTGDLVVNFNDFDAFATLFDQANGPGAFAALTSVPEPSTLLMFALGAIAFTTSRKLRSSRPSGLTAVFALVFALTLSLGSAEAQVTYVDAVADGNVGTVNTLATDGSALGTWYQDVAEGQNPVSDTMWSRRFTTTEGRVFGNGANDILQARVGSQNNDITQIKTTITGLTEGLEYEIYSFFWDSAGGEAWTIDAGLDENELTTYSGEGGATVFSATGYASALTFTDPEVSTGDDDPNNNIGFPTENRDLLYARIGTVVADATGSVDVFIDNSTAIGSNNRRSWYDGVGFAENVPDPTLTLEVDTVTGVINIKNEEAVGIDIRYYEIQSDLGSLNTNGWSTLDSGENDDPVGTDWDVADGSDSNILSEANLQSSLTLQSSEEVSLGNAFSIGSDQDLKFFYAEPGGALIEGTVSSVQGLTGDFDDDDDVDGGDFLNWQRAGFSGSVLDGWQSNYGTPGSLSSITAVPEPTALAAASIAMMLFVSTSRRKVLQ